jgi:hypothetical protein
MKMVCCIGDIPDHQLGTVLRWAMEREEETRRRAHEPRWSVGERIILLAEAAAYGACAAYCRKQIEDLMDACV